MSKRFAILIGVAAAVAVAVAVAALAGQTGRFESRVTIHRDPSFHGRVVSSEHACEVQREVTLYKVRGGYYRACG